MNYFFKKKTRKKRGIVIYSVNLCVMYLNYRIIKLNLLVVVNMLIHAFELVIILQCSFRVSYRHRVNGVLVLKIYLAETIPSRAQYSLKRVFHSIITTQ